MTIDITHENRSCRADSHRLSLADDEDESQDPPAPPPSSQPRVGELHDSSDAPLCDRDNHRHRATTARTRAALRWRQRNERSHRALAEHTDSAKPSSERAGQVRSKTGRRQRRPTVERWSDGFASCSTTPLRSGGSRSRNRRQSGARAGCTTRTPITRKVSSQ